MSFRIYTNSHRSDSVKLFESNKMDILSNRIYNTMHLMEGDTQNNERAISVATESTERHNNTTLP